MLNYINGYILYPILEKKINRKILSKFKELRAWDLLSPFERAEQQKQLFYKFLLHCEENIPYYRRVFRDSAFTPDLILKDLRNIKRLPLLTKEIVRENRAELLNSNAPPTQVLHARKTGGSTGQSVFFYYSEDGLDWTAAMNLYSLHMAGKKFHHTDCHICAELEFGELSTREKIKLMSQNRSRLMIDSFDDQSLEKYRQQLLKIKPYMLQGHPSSAFAISDYIRRSGRPIKKICTVFEPTGEMLTEKMVSSIEQYLQCKVVNRYGNAEFGAIAHSKLKDHYRKLRVFDRAFYVEDATSGPIIVSNFTNSGFPLLRYDTGDIGSVNVENGETYIFDILGRKHDEVEIQGTKYPTHYIMDYLDHRVKGVREFQIVIVESDPILRIVPEEKTDIQRIQGEIAKRWPAGLSVEFIEFAELEKVGWREKFRHVIDKRPKST